MLAYCILKLEGHETGCGMVFCGGVLLRWWRRETDHGADIPWWLVFRAATRRPFRPGIIIHEDPFWNINRGMAAWPGGIRPAQRFLPRPCQN